MVDEKIGIITLNYKGCNYGNALQAYALCKVFDRLGYNAEQIEFCTDTLQKQLSKKQELIKLLRKSPFNFFKYMICYPFKKINQKLFKSKDRYASNVIIQERMQAFNRFFTLIPHSKDFYTKQTICDSISQYDYFVTGSDQVWNMEFCSSTHFLDFVPKSVPKFSYAASIALNSLTSEQEQWVEKYLVDFTGISVREQQAVKLIENIVPQKPVVSLDPTLLLDEKEWDNIAESPVVKGNYVFCYFLSPNRRNRELSYKFAKSMGLKVVMIPYVSNSFNHFDNKYSDEFVFKASPEKFISLIKHATYICTDSFHASVFSLIYKKNFFVFPRGPKKDMSSRIDTLLQQFGTQSQYCYNKQSLSVDYMINHCNILYKDKENFMEMKRQSLEYLVTTLQKCKKSRANNINSDLLND